MRILDQITGKAIEQQVAEYSEVYGEVLLGLHRDFEHLQASVAGVQRALTRVQQMAEGLAQRADRLDRQHAALRTEMQEALARVKALAQDLSDATFAKEQAMFATSRVNALAQRVEKAEAELVSLRAAVTGLKTGQTRTTSDEDAGPDRLPSALLWRELEVQRRRTRLLAFLCAMSLLLSVLLGVMTWTNG